MAVKCLVVSSGKCWLLAAAGLRGLASGARLVGSGSSQRACSADDKHRLRTGQNRLEGA